MDSIYLDNNATTLLDPFVGEAMAECDRAGFANPSSQHRAGQRARRKLAETTDAALELLGSRPSDRLIWTSGGTESNNLAIRGLVGDQAGNVILSSIEHPSVLACAESLERQGHEIRRLTVDVSGRVDPAELAELIDEQTRLVSVMLANHETGVVQPVAEIAQICRERGVPCHTDAVQAVGKLPFDFAKLGVDAASVAAHKFHGPRGIGALVVRDATRLLPLLHGGLQQLGMRPGTEPVTLAVGLRVALERCLPRIDEISASLSARRDAFERQLSESIADLAIHGSESPRVPHVTSAAFPRIDRQAFLIALDMAAVACSTGSACASGSSEPSPVLLEMGICEDVVETSLRFSLSRQTTDDELAQAATRIIRVYNDLRRQTKA